MQNYTWTAVFITAISLALTSCDPPTIEITDQGRLTGVYLEFDNEDPDWYKDETRVVTVKTQPGDAEATDVTLRATDGLFRLSATDSPSRFTVTAMDGATETEEPLLGSIWAVVDNVSSRKYSFRLLNHSTPPPTVTPPSLEVFVSLSGDRSTSTPCPSTFLAEDGKEYIFEARCSSSEFTIALLPADPEIAHITQSGASSWTVTPSRPGETELCFTATDPATGKSYTYARTLAVFGHILLEAVYDLNLSKGGFRMADGSGYDGLTGNVLLEAVIYGWPLMDEEDIIGFDIFPYSGEASFSRGSDNSHLLDAREQQEQIARHQSGEDGHRLCYLPHRIEMDFTVTLKSAFIVIDGILDSDDVPPPDTEFSISATLVQKGIKTYQDATSLSAPTAAD